MLCITRCIDVPCCIISVWLDVAHCCRVVCTSVYCCTWMYIVAPFYISLYIAPCCCMWLYIVGSAAYRYQLLCVGGGCCVLLPSAVYCCIVLHVDVYWSRLLCAAVYCCNFLCALLYISTYYCILVYIAGYCCIQMSMAVCCCIVLCIAGCCRTLLYIAIYVGIVVIAA